MAARAPRPGRAGLAQRGWLGPQQRLDMQLKLKKQFRFLEARVQGIEPVAELRQQAEILNEISSDDLREGDALQLPFADDSFDWVVETGVLHHIRHWPRAVAEMARVARYGVLISDTTNIGQGSPRTRRLKKLIKKLGLWNVLVWLQTKGEVDGFYWTVLVPDIANSGREEQGSISF